MVSDPSGRADPEAVALLRSARQQAEASLSPEHRARLAARLAGSLGPPPGGPGEPPPAGPAPGAPAAGPSSPAPPPAMAASLATAVTSKAAVALVSLALGGALGFQARGVIEPRPAAVAAASAAPAEPVAAPAPPASSTPAPEAAAAPAAPAPRAPSTPAEPSAPSPPAEPSAPLSREESLRAERALIDMARTAIGRGQAAGAVAALQRHAAEFPAGRLAEEREGMWIQALVVSGRSDEARARLERFRRSFPRSMMLPGLESALEPRPR